MSIKIKKTNRGFSLVELMVVVAIMGTLSAIAIPAYNDYRKSAKKTTYRSDLSGLHKGWLAFGVENDDFCERETTPSDASIENVGMAALTTSKLYGNDAAIVAETGVCDTGTNKCTNSRRVGAACSAAADCDAPAIPAGNGPGKANFIGFGAETCTNIANLGPVMITDGGQGQPSTGIAGEADCDLAVTRYELGVVGHISGDTWFGQSISNLGVLSAENQAAASAVDPQCS